MNIENAVSLADSLPHVAEGDAQSTRLLFDQRVQRLLRQYCPDLRIEYDHRPEFPNAIQLTFAAQNTTCDLWIPDELLPSLASVVQARDWPASLRLQCIWTVLLAEWTKAAELIESLGLTLVAAERANPDKGVGAEGIGFVLGRGASKAVCMLRNFNEVLLKHVHAQVALNAYACARDGLDISPDASLVCGVRTLAWSVLRSLRVGDALIMAGREGEKDRNFSAQLSVGSAAGRRAYRRVQWNGDSVIVQGERWMSEDAAVDKVLPRADDSVRGSALEDVEVDVQLELQLVTMPMSVLSAMQPGYILELPVAVEDASVCLVVGGRVIGHAQLMRVGDRLAARITGLKNESNRTIGN
jgi:type III secretion system YscQ/HrcQ family protein